MSFPQTTERFMTKEEVKSFALAYSVETRYDGDEKIMYFKGLRAQEAIDGISSRASTAFKMKVTEK